MRLHVPQALEYLKDAGFEMSQPTYFRQKKKIENMKLERMQRIAMYFQDQHLDRVDRVELVEKLMWDNYHAEKDPTKKVNILVNIMHMQTYISAYYDTTRYVLETRVKTYGEIEKSPHTYLSIDVRDRREKEIGKEDEKREFEYYHQRQQETLLTKNTNINPPLPPPLQPSLSEPEPEPDNQIHNENEKMNEEFARRNRVASLRLTTSDPKMEEEKEEQETETEQDRYWLNHPNPKPTSKDKTKFVSER